MDGAPSHFSVKVPNYLDDVFQNMWIRRRGTIMWSARSPDLTPISLYIFLWGYLKKINKSEPDRSSE